MAEIKLVGTVTAQSRNSNTDYKPRSSYLSYRSIIDIAKCSLLGDTLISQGQDLIESVIHGVYSHILLICCIISACTCNVL